LATPSAAGERKGGPAPGMGGGQIIILMVMFLAITLLFNPSTRMLIGGAVGFVFEPVIGFGGSYPIITLLIAGTLMMFISTILRHFFVDWVSQARNQRIVSAFQKEFRKARLENNMYKIKKLNEVQREVMSKSMSGMQTQMKLMPVTMAVIIPVFAWLSIFVYSLPNSLFSAPWYWDSDLTAIQLGFMPSWILLYSVLTLPFSQVLSRILRYFSFRKRLRKLESGGGAANEG
jgi:uncharacterized membrane protein (DUF106 family)